MTETAWKIRDTAATETRDSAIWSPLRLRVFRADQPIFVGRVSVLASYVHDAATSLGIAYDSETGRAAVDSAMARYGIRRLEEGLRRGAFPIEPTNNVVQLQINDADLPVFIELLRRKSCRWQIVDQGELLCSAASAQDETVVAVEGRHRFAPTTRPTCQRCDLPDSDIICSHLSHPQITSVLAMGGPPERHVAEAYCELGRDEVGQPGECRSGGHPCFERLVEEKAEAPTLPSAMALAEAFDYLDAVWRLHFGKERHLLRMPTAADVAGLAQPAESRADLETRLSDLADVLSTLDIPDDLLPPESTPDQMQGSLNRLNLVLRSALDPDAWPQAEAAIKILRAVNHARVAAQHGARAPDLPKAFSALGLPYPPPTAGLAWDQIRARTIQALGVIREEIRRLSTRDP